MSESGKECKLEEGNLRAGPLQIVSLDFRVIPIRVDNFFGKGVLGFKEETLVAGG